MKKRKKQNIALAIIAAIIIGIVVVYNYSIDQAKIQGFNFGNELKQIQDDIKQLESDFDSKVVQWKEGDLSKEELLEYSQEHISKLEAIIPRYDSLTPPDSFASAVDLFKLSTESQLESDKQYIRWIETGDESYKIRAGSLFQESFEYEIAALAEYQAAQQGKKP